MHRYLQERQELLRAAVPGTSSARRLARSTDEQLRGLACNAAARLLNDRVSWSLVALGGYGAGALLPASDLDLLVISNAPAATLKPFVEAILYPLWDSGLSVGHQVRSSREQLTAVRTDLATLTATLTGRVLAGDEALGTEVLRACAADATKRRTGVLAALHARSRPGSPYLLEADLKDGAGGRRDFDELTWTASVLTGAPASTPAALTALGLLEPEHLERLTRSADTIAAARWELQLSSGGSFMSEELAEELSTSPADVQHALADTHHLLLRTRRRLAVKGRRAASSGAAVRGAMDADQLLELIGRGPAALDSLEDAAWAGDIDHLVPQMSELLTLRRPGIAHTRTVGAHSLVCAVETARILDLAADSRPLAEAMAGGDPSLAGSARRVADPRALTVAALTHDTGKLDPGPGHSERGVAPARKAAERLALGPDSAAHVCGLVRHHLLLAEIATSVDLDDPSAITEAARKLGEEGLLAPLHVLTVADSLATGPGAWSEWHATLVGTLVTRIAAHFADDAIVREGRGRTATPDVGTVGGIGYATETARLAGLAARLGPAPTPGMHVLDVGSGPIDGSHRLTIVAPDRPGLLVTFAGAIGLAGLDILAARSANAAVGVVADTFVVASATLAAPGADTWSRLERLLTAALSGRLAVGVRLAERRRHYTARATGPLETSIDDDLANPGMATLHVRAPDRVGLLHDIARAIAESGLDVSSLTATSRAGLAEDTFRLTLAEETGAGALGQLAMRLREL